MQNRRGVDSFEDIRQTALRLEVLRVLAVVVCLVLGMRLLWLQVLNHENYTEQAEQNRVRILSIPARRGTIYDRKGRVLVTSRNSYNIVLSREKGQKLEDKIDLIVDNLKVDREWLTRRFETAKYEPKYEYIVVKEMATPEDVAWVTAHEYDQPELSAIEAPQRLYVHGQFAAHALGYVGEVDKKELKEANSPFSEAKGFKLGDIIGKSGFERYYNDILMGRDGERRVIVDSRGQIKSELSRIEPIPGRDVYTTLDYDIQLAAETQGDQMQQGRGVIVALDPNTDEVLAMVSRPAFDPNAFSQRSKTPEGREEISDYWENEDRPLYNRAIQGRYVPGSTWKMLMAVGGLSEGDITLENSRLQDGGLQIGNYYMKSLSHLGSPEIHLAIVKSADGYFYRLGLKMGIEKIEKWEKNFQIGQRTGIDLPHEIAGIAATREWKEKLAVMYKNPSFAKWTSYDTASASIGQSILGVTPLQLVRYIAALSQNGQMYTPHLLLKVMPGIDRFGNQQGELRYDERNKIVIEINPKVAEKVKKGMWGVVNEGGTGAGTKIEGFEIAGKTGTAQVASTARVGKESKDHAWFVSFAPFEKPEIAMVVLTENVGFGSTFSVPKARAIYEDYYRRTRGVPTEMAKNNDQ
ncbi:MAG TPA: penicillin-binding protein 2 [Blastocatellia bacterium]|nr:penicillin-binding protein 2 [Blastocatellia bacterium]